MGENQHGFAFDPSSSRDPSQVVTYTSRFVDRLSDVIDDMCVSGSLSIKAAKLGGSGKGSFVDSDKFKESDLNFYISVKVINHTVNFKMLSYIILCDRWTRTTPIDFGRSMATLSFLDSWKA